MDLKELERIIVEEVSKALTERQRGEDTMLPADQNTTLDAHACRGPVCSMPTATKPTSSVVSSSDQSAILCIFTGAREKWEVIVSGFQSWLANGFRLDAIYSTGSQDVIHADEMSALGLRNIDNPAEVRDILHDMTRYRVVFLPSISRTHAAKLALGITDTVTLNLSLSALAQKAPTIASSDGLAPTACISCGNHVPGIQEVLDNYRKHLAKMGLRLLPAEAAVKEIQRVVANQVESGPDLITCLVTETDAAQLNGPVVKIARGGLITPLAMEQLYKRGIEVVIVPQNM